MNPLIIKELSIGTGKPKICVSITNQSKLEIMEAANALLQTPFDLLEWRADGFEHVSDLETVCDVLKDLKSVFSNKPILFTFRTKEEGGMAAIGIDDYIKLNKQVIDSQLAELVDLEFFKGEDALRPLIEAAHEKKIYVVLSNHDFNETPYKAVLLGRLIQMQDLGGDIVKIAVMPKSKQDVLNLMETTITMINQYARVPVVTMAMGELGKISRVTGEFTGSAITFGSGQSPSAPGQIPANELAEILELLSLKY